MDFFGGSFQADLRAPKTRVLEALDDLSVQESAIGDQIDPQTDLGCVSRKVYQVLSQ